MNKFVHAAVLSTAMLVAGQAGAATITLDVVDAKWVNVMGGANVVTSVDGLGNATVRWGGPVGGPRPGSSYVFDPSAPPFISVTEGVDFTLGDFTHNNFPIPTGSGITSADLELTLDLTIDGNFLDDQGPFTFLFAHVETANNCDTGPDCSNDLVTVSNSATPVSFIFGGREYTLDILGFEINHMPVSSFSTVENQTNTAPIVAQINARDIEVPAPESLPLLGLGLLGLGSLLRRRS